MDDQREGIGRVRLEARLTVFGSEPGSALLEVTPRPRARRATRAAGTAAATLVVAAAVALLPPHLPWLLAALAVGGWRTRGEWRGEYELHGFEGSCPRCGEPLRVVERYITPPLQVPCFACHAQVQLTLER
jgi:hypothetical protein